MKVAVVTSSPPLAEGGHLVIARSVVEELRSSAPGRKVNWEIGNGSLKSPTRASAT